MNLKDSPVLYCTEENIPYQYEVERATVWRVLDEVYKGFINLKPLSRLSLDKAVTILSTEEKDFDVIPSISRSAKLLL